MKVESTAIAGMITLYPTGFNGPSYDVAIEDLEYWIKENREEWPVEEREEADDSLLDVTQLSLIASIFVIGMALLGQDASHLFEDFIEHEEGNKAPDDLPIDP